MQEPETGERGGIEETVRHCNSLLVPQHTTPPQLAGQRHGTHDGHDACSTTAWAGGRHVVATG